MLKYFVCLILFLGQVQTLDIQGYTEFIDKLNNDVKFIDEYMTWSSKLFAQSNYLYGDVHKTSPCSIETIEDDDEMYDDKPESVHQLRPKNVNCIAAFGDSFTTGLNAHATTPADLLLEDRGLSIFSIRLLTKSICVFFVQVYRGQLEVIIFIHKCQHWRMH